MRKTALLSNRSFLAAILAAGVCGGSLLAAPALVQTPPHISGDRAQAAADEQMDPMHRAIKRHFPGLKVEEGEVRDINGVKVTELKITNGDGRVSAGAITEHGDFLLAGIPHDPKKLPGPVHNVINRLFATPPDDIVCYTVTTYVISLETNGERDGVVFDAVGRLKGLHPAAQGRHEEEMMSHDDVMGKDDARSKEAVRRMQSMADRFFGEGSTVKHVYADPMVENFYHVELTNKEGREFDAVTNGNDVFARSEKLEPKEIPAAVMSSVQELFRNAKVVGVHRRTYDFYQFEEKTNGGDTVVLRIGTNGDVLDVNSAMAHQQNQEIQGKNHR